LHLTQIHKDWEKTRQVALVAVGVVKYVLPSIFRNNAEIKKKQRAEARIAKGIKVSSLRIWKGPVFYDMAISCNV
jgi:hypothetical protein